MTIGAQIGAAFLNLAADLALGVFGLLAFLTVVSGILIVTNIGGTGIQKFVRQYLLSMFWGVLLTGSFEAICRGLQSVLHVA